MRSLFNDVILPITLIGGVLLIVANASSSKDSRTNPLSMSGFKKSRRYLSSADEAEFEESEEFLKNEAYAKKNLDSLKNSDNKTKKIKKKKKRDALNDLMIAKAFFEVEK